MTKATLARIPIGFSLTFAALLLTFHGDAQSYHRLGSGPKPIAAWSFAQAHGDFVPDSSGHGYDAQIFGQPQPEPRWRGYVGMAFDGSGDNSFWQGGAQNCGLGVARHLNQAFTELSIEAWVRKQPAWWMPVVYRDLWDNSSGFGLYMEWSSGKAVFGHYDSIGHRSVVQSVSVVQDGQWHYVVGTMQPAAGGGYLYRIYVDGQLDAEQVGLWAVDEAPAEAGILKIAYPNASGADNPMNGALDGIAIYDVALTPAQVQAHYEATRARSSRQLQSGQPGTSALLQESQQLR